MQQDDGPYHAAGLLGQQRRALVAAGFTPLPLHGKSPPAYGKNGAKKGLGRWQHLEDVTPEQIDGWMRVWPDAGNTGILTKYTPALDFDILNEAAAIAAEDLVRARFEEHGTVLVRIGKPPKRAILFRTNEPFKKILTNVTAPNGSAEKIEVLGDGQQLVVAGIHPDTKAPYRWHGGEPGPIRHEDLPLITSDEAKALVEDLVGLLVQDFSYRRLTRRKSAAGAQANSGATGWADLVSNISAGHALHDSLRDLAAKMIRSGMQGGACVNQLRALMAASQAPRDERFKDRFGDIPRLVEIGRGPDRERDAEGRAGHRHRTHR
jgi:bifunctional DNA primase/polymerase-like protein